MTTLSADDLHAIGVEAYVYLYPLVTMEITRRQLCSGPADAQPGRGPAGMFHHIRSFPAADFKVVVRPNFDTLYSSAWLDVSAEPLVVSAADSEGRYFLLPMLDMWTDVFAAPGTRTSGGDAQAFAVCTPEWTGDLPAGVRRIDAPTPVVWLVGRTQTNGPADYAAVHAFQDALSITPLSAWGASAPEPAVLDDPAYDTTTPPLELVNAMSARDYFALGAELMRTHRPHATDWGIVARMGRAGLVAGEPFDLAEQPAAVQAALTAAPEAGLRLLGVQMSHIAPVVGGWMNPVDGLGVYGNSYARRAAVSMVGLGANQPVDAVYPLLVADADGAPLDGSHAYVLHFDADGLPPVDAFWSVTMYDADGFQVANEIDRFAIGDRDALTFNGDGSLDLYLQHANPGPDVASNWLPAPAAGALGVTMRLYAPRESVLSGAWTPPPVRRVG